MFLIILLVSFIASVIGSVFGIGGGIIIKQVMDSIGIFDIPTISFLSGASVLAMAIFSIAKSSSIKNPKFDKKIAFFLALGATLGGNLGKWLFQYVILLTNDKNKVGAIQAICVLLITIGTLVYTLNKEKFKTHNFKSLILCIVVGLSLGLIASFLGIGGGPINLIMLLYFFSMDIKTAAENSLYIVLFSQFAGVVLTIFKGNVPEFRVSVFLTMIIAGIIGGLVGQTYKNKISGKLFNNLFIAVNVLLIGISIFNVFKFM